MTTFWWVRHGPTHQQVMTGWRDVPADLSDRAALARLAAVLPQGAALISSDLLRARATADALGHPGPRLPDAPGLREINLGEWDGLSGTDIAARWPDLSRHYWTKPGAATPPGGESWDAFAARVGEAVDALAAAGHADLVLVAHQGVILAALARASGMAPGAALAFAVAPLSLTRIAGPGPGARIEGVNRIW